MDRSVKKYLYDIQEAIESIESYIGERKDFTRYMSNKMLRRAVERELEIIGEAMNRIDKTAPGLAIGSKRQIIGMRNRVIHGYNNIDDVIVWGTVIRHLPRLKQDIEQLMEQQ